MPSLCFFVFVLMFAIGMASPVVPLYAFSLGATWIEIGLMGTSWGLTVIVLAVLSGKMSDRFGRKPLLVVSSVLSAVAAILYLASSTVQQVILIRILEGMAWALFWPTLEAFATEIADPANVGRAMGFTTASYGVASASGSIAGGSITSALGYGQMFLSYLVLSVASVIVAVLFLREVRPQRISSSIEDRQEGSDARSLVSRPLLLAYFLAGVYTFGLGIVLTFFSVFAKNLGVAIFWIGMFFGLFWVGRIVASIGGGRLSDKYGRKPAAVVAMIGCGLGFILVAIAEGSALLTAAVVVLGFSVGTAFPVGLALVSDNVRQSVRGYAMGIFETSCGTGFMAASTAGGFLADLYTPRAPYYLGAFVSILSATVLVVGLPHAKSLKIAK